MHLIFAKFHYKIFKVPIARPILFHLVKFHAQSVTVHLIGFNAKHQWHTKLILLITMEMTQVRFECPNATYYKIITFISLWTRVCMEYSLSYCKSRWSCYMEMECTRYIKQYQLFCSASCWSNKHNCIWFQQWFAINFRYKQFCLI